MVACGVALDV